VLPKYGDVNNHVERVASTRQRIIIFILLQTGIPYGELETIKLRINTSSLKDKLTKAEKEKAFL